jgi:hypothetical protein
MNFTERVLKVYASRKKEMENTYEKIMNEIIATQASDKHISDILEKHFESDQQFKNKSFEFTISLNLQPLFESGIWLKSDDGTLIDFSKSMEYIKNHHSIEGKYLYNLWEDWIKTEPVLQNFYTHLKSLFPGAIVQSPCCYWYEKSEFLEIKFRISIKLYI